MSDKKHSFENEFASLPLEQKIAALLRMEVATLGETLTYIASSSAKAVEQAGEFIHDVGEKIETEVKKAAAGAGACGTASTASADEPRKASGTKKASSAKGGRSKPRNSEDARGL